MPAPQYHGQQEGSSSFLRSGRAPQQQQQDAYASYQAAPANNHTGGQAVDAGGAAYYQQARGGGGGGMGAGQMAGPGLPGMDEQQHSAQLAYHRSQIDKLSQRIYDGLYQLIKIKFGFAENNSDALQVKFSSLVKEKLADLQSLAQQSQQMNPNYLAQQKQRQQ